MREPRNCVAFAAPRRMLNQIAPPRAMLPRIGEQLADDIELMIARKDLFIAFFAGVGALFFDDLGVVFQNVGQALFAQNRFPEVLGRESGGIRRVARAVVPAHVKRQKPRGVVLQMGAHPHFAVIHRKMRGAAAKMKQQFSRVAVAFILLHGVCDRLFGQRIFQLEREDRQAVDEHDEIEGAARGVGAIPELARDAENVLLMPRLRFRVVRGGRAIKQIKPRRAVADAVTQHVNHAALFDFALQPVQKFHAARRVGAERERGERLRLRRLDKRGEFREIDGVFAVIVLRVACDISGVVNQ